MTKDLLSRELLHTNAAHNAGKGFDPDQIYTFCGHQARRTRIAGPHAYKPSMIRLHNGNVLVSYTTYDVDPRGQAKGRIEIVRSIDHGKSWSQPLTAVGPEHTPGDHYLIHLSEDNILLCFMQIKLEEPKHPWQGPVFCRSVDGGQNWSSPWLVDTSAFSPNGPYVACDRSHVYLPDGDLLLFVGVYDPPEHPRNFMMISHDQGSSFPEYQLVSDNSGDSTFTLCSDGSIAGALRINADDFPHPKANPDLEEEHECVHFMGFTRSEDRGQTWSPPHPITGFNEIPGHLIELNDGRLMLTYGVRHFPIGVRAVLTKPDRKTWDLDNPVILAWHGTTSFVDDRPGGKNTIGHPYTIQFPDDSMLTVYYYAHDPLKMQFQIEGVTWSLDTL